MFSKIDKKVLSILIVVVALALLAGFAGYKYVVSPKINVENKAGGADTEAVENQNPQVITNPNIEIETSGQSGGGTLMVCTDQCGNGICQPANPECVNDASKCTCAEDIQSCPEDCK